MKTNSFSLLSRFSICLFAGLMIATPAFAADALHDVQTRMEQRLSQLDPLKSKGVIGENNRGLVEVREGGAADAGSLVSAENADRETVYAAIAAKTQVSAEEVGKARARRIAQASSAGVWIQAADGSWKKK